MDITTAYERVWKFTPPRKCQEIHAARLFAGRGKNVIDLPVRLAVFEVYDAKTIAEGDAWLEEDLIAGLVPIGGDSSGDRWCFDTRLRVGGTIPVLYCPHDGGGAVYVAPSFAGFMYRLVVENLLYAHIFKDRGIDRDGVRKVTRENLALLDRWLLRRWVRRATNVLDARWPTYDNLDKWLREDPAFARMPSDELDHFRPTD